MSSKNADHVRLVDPRTLYPAPPFEDQQQIDSPGNLNELSPSADHGEESYTGTASIQGYDPGGYLLPYSASKSALLGMTKSMAKLAIDQGVRVNAVAPGPVWTPLIPSTMPNQKIKNFGDNTVFKRPAHPIELGPLYVWLASPAASYVTGEVFGCTGGRSPV